MFKAVRTAKLASAAYFMAFDNTIATRGNPNFQGQAAALVGQTSGDEIVQRSNDSAAMLPYWEQVADIVAGRDAMVAAGQKYLPQFNLEDSDDYKVRLKLAKFTNVYNDVVENLASKPFEKEVEIKDPTPPELIEFAEDVDGGGNSLTVFAADYFFNAINNAVDWLFVDYPSIADPAEEGSRPRTIADEKAAGLRPYWSRVTAANVLEAKLERIAGKLVLTLIRILEIGEDARRVRKMWSDSAGVHFEVWKENKNAKTDDQKWIVESSGQITLPIIPMVPLVTGRRDGTRYFFKPPMRDAADLQLDLYQQESGLKYIKTLTAYPMVSGQGVNPEIDPTTQKPKPLGIGPGRVLYAKTSPDGRSVGKFEFIEPTSSSLTFLAADIKDTIQQLRELGRQPLTAQSGNLTVITTAVAAGKARSAVAKWAINLKDALEMGLYITGLWMALRDPKPQVEVFTEFDDYGDLAADITALQTMRKDGDLSQETYWEEMKRRKVLSDEFDAGEERKLLLDETPDDTNGLDDNGNPINPDNPGQPIVKQPSQQQQQGGSA